MSCDLCQESSSINVHYHHLSYDRNIVIHTCGACHSKYPSIMAKLHKYIKVQNQMEIIHRKERRNDMRRLQRISMYGSGIEVMNAEHAFYQKYPEVPNPWDCDWIIYHNGRPIDIPDLVPAD